MKENKVPAATAPDSGRRLLRSTTIAARFDVCARTVANWAKAYPDMIHPYRPSAQCVLYDEAEIEAFIRSSRI